MIAQDHTQVDFEYLQGWKTHSCCGQHTRQQCSAVLILKTSGSLEEASCVSVSAYCLLSSHWAPIKRAWLHLLHFLARNLQTLIRCPISILFSMQNSLTHSLSHSSGHRCSCPVVILVALCQILSGTSMFVLFWGSKNWTKQSRCDLAIAKQRGRITSLGLLKMLCLIHAGRALALFLWLKSTLLVHAQLGVQLQEFVLPLADLDKAPLR